MTDITRGTVTSKQGTTNSSLGVTVSGNDTYLLFMMMIADVTNPAHRAATVDHNGTSMARLGGSSFGSNQAETEIWGLANPDAGTNNVNFSFAGGIDLYQVYAIPLANVDQSTSYDDVQTGSGSSTSGNVTLTSSKDRNQNYAIMGLNDGTGFAAQSGETIVSSLAGFIDSGMIEEDNVITPAGAATIGGSWTNSGAWGETGISMRPVDTPSDGTIIRLLFDKMIKKNGILQPRKGLYLPNGQFQPI